MLVAAISVPDTIGSDTCYLGMGWAVIPLSMSVLWLLPNPVAGGAAWAWPTCGLVRRRRRVAGRTGRDSR